DIGLLLPSNFPTLRVQHLPKEMDERPRRAPARTVGMYRDLVEAAQRGDQDAFVDLVRLQGDRLYAVAHRILRDADRAEDALQDALVIPWRDLPTLRDLDRFEAWMHRVLTHVCIGHATRERGRIAQLRVLPIEGPAAHAQLISGARREQ